MKLLLGVLVTTAFIYLISSQLEWDLVWTAILEANLLWLPLCTLPWLAGIYIRIYRWSLMLKAHAPELTIKNCIWPYLISAWLNITVPLRAGDFARAFGFRTQLQSPATRVLGTLVLERVFDLLIIVLFFFAGLMSATAAEAIPPLFATIAGTAAGVAIFMLLTLLIGQNAFRRIIRRFSSEGWFFRYSMSRRMVSWLDHFFDGVSCLKSQKSWVQVTALTLALWLCEATIYIIVAISLNLKSIFLAPLFSFTTATLATALPSAPGFVGTYDYFGALGAVAYGIDWNHAAAFIVVAHVILLAPICLIPLAYVLCGNGLPKFGLSADAHTTDNNDPKTHLETG